MEHVPALLSAAIVALIITLVLAGLHALLFPAYSEDPDHD